MLEGVLNWPSHSCNLNLKSDLFPTRSFNVYSFFDGFLSLRAVNLVLVTPEASIDVELSIKAVFLMYLALILGLSSKRLKRFSLSFARFFCL